MKRFVTRARARGWREPVEGRLDGLRRWWSDADSLIVLSRPTAVDGAETAYRARSCSIEDAERYEKDIGTDTAESFRARLTHRTDCFVVDVEGRFVHASWVAREKTWIGEIQHFFVPPENSAYIYESYTRPEMRGRGIYPDALRNIASQLADAGIEELWIGVEATNRSSVRAIEKAGFERRFEIAFSRRLGRLTVDLSRVTMARGGAIAPSDRGRV